MLKNSSGSIPELDSLGIHSKERLCTPELLSKAQLRDRFLINSGCCNSTGDQLSVNLMPLVLKWVHKSMTQECDNQLSRYFWPYSAGFLMEVSSIKDTTECTEIKKKRS